MTVCLKAQVFNHSWKFDGYEDSRKCDLFRPLQIEKFNQQ